MAQTLVYCLFRCIVAAMTAVSLPATSFGQDAQALNWFQSTVQDGTGSAWYRWAVDPAVADSESAELTIVTDGHCSLYVNGQRILKNVCLMKSGDSVTALGFDVRSLLRQGRNTVAVEVHSADKVALLGIAISAVQGERRSAVGGMRRMTSIAPPVGWQQTDFNDRDWIEAMPVNGDPADRLTVAAPEKFAAPVEATLAGTCGDKHVTFRNLGWSADTVFADSRGIFDKPDVGYLRMVEHIRAEEPTVAFICYGQNEALTAGMTPEQYSQQLNRLLDELAASGIACVLVSPHELLPPPRPIPSPARFNSKIKVYSDATASVAQSRGLLFVDLFSDFANRMREIDYEIHPFFKLPPELERQTDNPSDMAVSIYRSFSENVMHFTEHGYVCASAIVRERLLEIPASLPVVVVDPKSHSVGSDAGHVRNVRWNPDDTKLVTFDLQQKYLFGFRKHEQGNNAADIAKFDPLILELEKQIHEPRQPHWRQVTFRFQ